jgi:hypothetical protein
MKLVEAEAEGPIDGEAAVVTPPRPPHRRVSISLLFTLTVLTGTVVAIYLVFPARHDALLTQAIAEHRGAQLWELEQPTPAALRAWVTGAVGAGAPLPLGTPIGARTVAVLERRAGLVQVRVAGETITYVVQPTRGLGPPRSERAAGDLWGAGQRRGKFAWALVGPRATAAAWLPAAAPR